MMDNDLQVRWWNLEQSLAERFGKKPDMEAVLFLIGIQELGIFKDKWNKEQKQDLIHIGTCTVLGLSGYYEMERVDADGWPHFRQIKRLPELSFIQQDQFLKDHVLLYFQNNQFL